MASEIDHAGQQPGDRPAGTRKPSLASRVLGHSLTPTVVAVLVGSWLIPTWIQLSQDHQAELKLKSELVEQIASATTPAVRTAVVLVLQHNKQEFQLPSQLLNNSYFNLKNDWLLNRALIRSKVSTFFPSLDKCWFEYSDVITSFISIPQPNVASADALSQVQEYVQNDNPGGCAPVASSVDFQRARLQELRTRIRWMSLRRVADPGFRSAYSDLGEVLLIYRDGFTSEVNGSEASGIRHGWWS